MTYQKLVAFDRPLAGVSRPGAASRACSEAELAELSQVAYRRGVDSARASADQQMVEFRADVEQLSEGVLQKLTSVEPMLLAQLREALPGLALEIARRLLAGYEPPAEVVGRLCEEALAELFPERENLELTLSPRDANLLTELNPGWMQRFPGLAVRTDQAFHPGDCQVRSRFGVTDARRETKLTALAHSLIPA